MEMASKTSETRPPRTEVEAKARRRSFTAAYKLDVLRRADACKEPGAIGELLRREGLYSSHLCVWRQQRARGGLSAETKKRGPKATPHDARDQKIAEQEKTIARLTARAERAEKLVELQKKVAELLGEPLPDGSEGKR